jgi:hypothetical protein
LALDLDAVAEREPLAAEALLFAPEVAFAVPGFADAFVPAERAAAAVFAVGFAGVAPLVEPVDAFFAALETLAANESSGRSRRLATTPPPSHMNLLRLAEGTPIPSSSGSVIPPPWD